MSREERGPSFGNDNEPLPFSNKPPRTPDELARGLKRQDMPNIKNEAELIDDIKSRIRNTAAVIRQAKERGQVTEANECEFDRISRFFEGIAIGMLKDINDNADTLRVGELHVMEAKLLEILENLNVITKSFDFKR